MALQVISSPGARAKDLALLFATISLALMIVPLLGLAILTITPNNYTTVFGCATFSSVLAAAVMILVRIQ